MVGWPLLVLGAILLVSLKPFSLLIGSFSVLVGVVRVLLFFVFACTLVTCLVFGGVFLCLVGLFEFGCISSVSVWVSFFVLGSMCLKRVQITSQTHTQSNQLKRSTKQQQ